MTEVGGHTGGIGERTAAEGNRASACAKGGGIANREDAAAQPHGPVKGAVGTAEGGVAAGSPLFKETVSGECRGEGVRVGAVDLQLSNCSELDVATAHGTDRGARSNLECASIDGCAVVVAVVACEKERAGVVFNERTGGGGDGAVDLQQTRARGGDAEAAARDVVDGVAEQQRACVRGESGISEQCEFASKRVGACNVAQHAAAAHAHAVHRKRFGGNGESTRTAIELQSRACRDSRGARGQCSAKGGVVAETQSARRNGHFSREGVCACQNEPPGARLVEGVCAATAENAAQCELGAVDFKVATADTHRDIARKRRDAGRSVQITAAKSHVFRGTVDHVLEVQSGTAGHGDGSGIASQRLIRADG